MNRNAISFILCTCYLHSSGLFAVSESLIAHYPLDGDAHDASGNGHDGILQGPVAAADRQGNPTGCLRFDGNDYIDIPDDPAFTLGNADFTIAALIQFGADGADGGFYLMGHSNGPGNTPKWILWLGNSGISFVIGPTPGWITVGLWNFVPNQWYHVAIRRQGTELSAFVDGCQIGSATAETTIPDPEAPLYLGTAEFDRPNRPFRGLLDDVRIYSVGLAQADILRLIDITDDNCQLIGSWSGTSTVPEGHPTLSPFTFEFTLLVTKQTGRYFDGIYIQENGPSAGHRSPCTGRLTDNGIDFTRMVSARNCAGGENIDRQVYRSSTVSDCQSMAGCFMHPTCGFLHHPPCADTDFSFPWQLRRDPDNRVFGLKSCGSDTACAESGPSSTPTILFWFDPEIDVIVEVCYVTNDSKPIDADGLAMSAGRSLYAFDIHRGANPTSTLVAIDKTTGNATAVGSLLEDREIRGAAFTREGRLLCVDSKNSALLELDPTTGAVTSQTPLQEGERPFDPGDGVDIVETGESMLLASVEDIYNLAPTTGQVTNLNVSGISGLYLAGAALSHDNRSLFIYDVNVYDDILVAAVADLAVSPFALDIINSFNAGRGDLATNGLGTELRFVRGDANSDGVLDISDPVFTLAFLFAGGRAPSCLDAADANDSGGFHPDISDPVFLLNWLFLGRTSPGARAARSGRYSSEACGFDPTIDGLGCLSFAPCN